MLPYNNGFAPRRGRLGALRRTLLGSAALTLLFTCGPTAQAQPPSQVRLGAPLQPAAAPIDPNLEVAVIDGKTVTAGELTSFSALLSTFERRVEEDPKAALEEYILTLLHADVYTTIPQPQSELAGIPTKYKYASQRGFLQQQLRAQIETEVSVTKEEMQKWYEANVGQYTQPEKVAAHHLFMEISADEPTSAPERVRQRMEQVKREADAGTSFALLAQRYSEASSGREGGYIGQVPRGRPFGPQGKPINPKLEEALFKLNPGEVSDIVQTSHGLHLLYAADRSTTVTPSLEDFMTSEILPRAVLREQIPQRRQELLQKTIQKHGGKIVEAITSGSAELTTATPAIEFGGKTFTVHDIEQIYGVPFTRAFARSKGDPNALQDLFRQVLELEAEVQAAIDQGIDKRPDVVRGLEMLEKRAVALDRLQDIYATAATITEELQKQKYEEMKENLRRPEGEGKVLILRPEQSGPNASPAIQLKSREELEKRAEEIRQAIDSGADFQKIVSDTLAADKNSTGGDVARHILNEMSGDPLTRGFDMAAGQQDSEGKVIGPLSYGENRIFAKVEKKYPGEPLPFEAIRPQLLRQLQEERQTQIREEIIQKLENSGKVNYLPGAAQYGKPVGGAAGDAKTTGSAAAQ